MKENSEIAEDLITSDQLFDKGIGGDGKELTPPYMSGYAELKKQIGLPGDRVTLYLEGDYHQSIFTRANKYPVTFGFSDSKAGKLSAKYGDKHKELTEGNKNKWFDELRPGTIERYRKEIGLPF